MIRGTMLEMLSIERLTVEWIYGTTVFAEAGLDGESQTSTGTKMIIDGRADCMITVKRGSTRNRETGMSVSHVQAFDGDGHGDSGY